MRYPQPTLVITHFDESGNLPQLPWLGQRHGVEEADRIVLTEETWRAVAAGAQPVLSEFERKLIWNSFIHQPERVFVVSHALDSDVNQADHHWQARRVADRVRSCLGSVPVYALSSDGEELATVSGIPAAASDLDSLPSGAWRSLDALEEAEATDPAPTSLACAAH